MLFSRFFQYAGLCAIPVIGVTTSSTSGSSRTVIYLNANTSLGLTKVITDLVNDGFNTLVMSFYTPNSSYDGGSVDAYSMALAWQQLSAQDKQSMLNLVHGVDGHIMLSMGGQMVHFNTSMSFITTGTPYETLGAAFGQYAKDQLYDGVDYDLENSTTGYFVTADFANMAVQTITANLTKGARNIDPSFVISSAPQGPYMASNWAPVSNCSSTDNCDTARPYGLCAYQGLCTESWGLDFLFVQYYNQSGNYSSYNTLFEQNGAFSGSAVKELTTGSVPYMAPSKLVVGKPVTTTDGGSGIVPLPDLKQWFCQYQQSGQQVGGAGYWEFRDQYEDTTDLQMAGGMMDPTLCDSPIYSTTTTTTTVFYGSGYLAAVTFSTGTPACNDPSSLLEVACCGGSVSWPVAGTVMNYQDATTFCENQGKHVCSPIEMEIYGPMTTDSLPVWSSESCGSNTSTSTEATTTKATPTEATTTKSPSSSTATPTEGSGYLAAVTFSTGTPACNDPSSLLEVACCGGSVSWPVAGTVMNYQDATTFCENQGKHVCSPIEMEIYGPMTTDSLPVWSSESCGSNTSTSTEATPTEATPTEVTTTKATPTENSNSPWSVIYVDANGDYTSIADIISNITKRGFNVLILAFWVPSMQGDISGSSFGSASDWEILSNQKELADQLHEAGGKIMLSVGGTTLSPYAMNSDYQAFGKCAGQYAQDHHYDGLDYDLENFAPGDLENLMMQNMTYDLMTGARSVNPDFLISAAPQPPYMASDWSRVYSCASIDNCDTNRPYGLCARKDLCEHLSFVFLQYYNNGVYVTYSEIFEQNSTFPAASVQELTTPGYLSDDLVYLEASKLVVGKTIIESDGYDSNYVPMDDLKSFFCQYNNTGNPMVGSGFWKYRNSDMNTEVPVGNVVKDQLEVAGTMSNDLSSDVCANNQEHIYNSIVTRKYI